MIFAIDPGNEESAFVILDKAGALVRFGKHENEFLLRQMREWTVPYPSTCLAIEMIASYGMPVGAEVFDTCVWIGRFIQARDGLCTRVYRSDVKSHLCHSGKATDANIRQALIDRYGPGKDKAIGTTKKRGPLYGVTSDVWQALAVAVTFKDGAATREARAA